MVQWYQISSAEAVSKQNSDQAHGLTAVEAQRRRTVGDALEDLDDVQNVYANLDVTDEVMAELDD